MKAVLVTVVALLAGAHAAKAADASDEFGCPQNAAVYGSLTFDDAQHRLWYRRFWTGNCEGLPFLSCLSGKPYWSETMQGILQKLPAVSRAPAILKLCASGKLIGHEWAKDNAIRRIDTKLVEEWIGRLDRAADPMAELAVIDAEAKQKLQGH